MENLDLYNSWREVPQTAQKIISGGNLNGKTDINPMWRIKVLTERFGPVGIGWNTRITEHWSDEQVIGGNVERVAWVRVELTIRINGAWSLPIEGIGGSKYAGKGRGTELNDEAFKMAETDAISVACKKLGIGADIYWQKDNTKYTQGGAQPTQQTEVQQKFKPITSKPEDAEWVNWLVKNAAEGFTREQCESAVNQRGRTIPAKLWEQIVTNL